MHTQILFIGFKKVLNLHYELHILIKKYVISLVFAVSNADANAKTTTYLKAFALKAGLPQRVHQDSLGQRKVHDIPISTTQTDSGISHPL